MIAISLIQADSEKLYVDYGSGQHRKGLLLSSVDLSSREKDAIIGFHTFTALFRKGKKRVHLTILRVRMHALRSKREKHQCRHK